MTPHRPGRPEASRVIWEWRAVDAAPGPDLRRTGILRGVFALVVASVFAFFAHLVLMAIVGTIGLVTLVAALVSPRRGYRAIHRFGDRLGVWIGTAIGFVLLPLLFFLVVTPLALIFRLQGRDGLARRRGGPTYWVTRDDDPRDAAFYRRQF